MTDRFERGTLLALLLLAFASLAGLLARVWTQGGVITGGDGFLVADPLQYLNWLRQAGEHVGIANLYDIHSDPPPRPFVHPGLFVSGLLHQLGLGLVLAYSVWKPVAVVAMFFSALLLGRRFLERTDDRRVVLVATLFTAVPVASFVSWLGFSEAVQLDHDFLQGELWPGNYLWGYQFTGIAVGLLGLGFVAYDRDRIWWAATCGLLCAWLQPWQGATLAGTLVVAEAFCVWRRGRDLRAAARKLAIPVVAIGLPLVYYFILSQADPAWELAGEVNRIPRWSLGVTILGLAPLALPALLAIRVPAPTFGDVALRVWPLLALVVYFQPGGTFPAHALQGLTFPLAILAMLGIRKALGARPVPLWPAVAVLAILIVPGTLYRANLLRDAVNKGFQPFFLQADERDALRALEGDPRAGGVLAPIYSGLLIPAYTGRETYVGAGSWSPQFDRRLEEMEALFGGRMDRAEAERLIRSTGARFLFSDCHGRQDISELVSGVTEAPIRFGCATIYPVRRFVIPDVRLPGLDGARAIAALTIVAYHVAFVLGGLDGPAGGYLAHLNIGVPIFFVLSGVLLTRPLLSDRRGSLRGYAVRRTLRIVPAYWVALPLVALWLGLDYVFTLADGPIYFFFLQQYSVDTFTGGIGQAWTLGVEVLFYASLPLIALALRRAGALPPQLAVLGVLFAASMAYKALVAPHSTIALTWLPGFLDQFALGMGLAVAAAAGVRVGAGVAWAAWVLAVGGWLLLGSAGGAPGDGPVQQALISHEAKGLIAFAVVLPAVLSPGGGPARCLAWRPLAWVGLVSYGVYLWHLAWIEQLDRWDWQDTVGTVGFAATSVAGALLLGWASWTLVERHAIAASRRLLGKADRRPATAMQEHAAP